MRPLPAVLSPAPSAALPAVPEPGRWMRAAAGLVAVGARRRALGR